MRENKNEPLQEMLHEVVESAQDFAKAEFNVAKARLLRLVYAFRMILIIGVVAAIFLVVMLFFLFGTLANLLGTTVFHSLWIVWGSFTLIFIFIILICVLIIWRTIKSMMRSWTETSSEMQEELAWLKGLVTLKKSETSSESTSEHPLSG